MKVSNITYRDFASFFAISGILLLTLTNYRESHYCDCGVNTRTHSQDTFQRDELESLLRDLLRQERFSPPSVDAYKKEDLTHGSR